MLDRSEPPGKYSRHGLSTARELARHLRSPQSGLLGQILRFGLTGGLVTVLYLTVTTVLFKVVGLPFEVALAIGFVSAILLHFTLQRLFVWINEEGYVLAFRHQVGRYLLMAGAQYGGTAAATAILPGALGIDTEIVYLATMAVATTMGFLVMRFIIFHGVPTDAAIARNRHEVSALEPSVGELVGPFSRS